VSPCSQFKNGGPAGNMAYVEELRVVNLQKKKKMKMSALTFV
jgi:hypothetical protein